MRSRLADLVKLCATKSVLASATLSDLSSGNLPHSIALTTASICHAVRASDRVSGEWDLTIKVRDDRDENEVKAVLAFAWVRDRSCA